MRILVCNDDGIYSPGIRALAEVAAEFGDVRIVAPDVERSSMGHAITAHHPLTYRKTPIGDFEAYRVNGTPADCVALGASQWSGVNVVLSGVNHGPNLGNSSWHSGTLAAARQAALLELRGIAVSAVLEEDEPDFEHLKPWMQEILAELLTNNDFPLLNVNLPQSPKGIHWTRQSVRHYQGHVTAGRDPRGNKHYWFLVEPKEETEKDTDRWAVQNGMASITPLRLDLTDLDEFNRVIEGHPKTTSFGWR